LESVGPNLIEIRNSFPPKKQAATIKFRVFRRNGYREQARNFSSPSAQESFSISGAFHLVPQRIAKLKNEKTNLFSPGWASAPALRPDANRLVWRW
jgi:hypothetical protein